MPGSLAPGVQLFRGNAQAFHDRIPRLCRASLSACTGTDTLRIKDGKFVEYWLNLDTLQLLAQLHAL